MNDVAPADGTPIEIVGAVAPRIRGRANAIEAEQQRSPVNCEAVRCTMLGLPPSRPLL